MVGEHVAHALARAFAPQRDDDAFAAGMQRRDMFGHSFEHVAARLGSFGGEVASLFGAGVDHRPLPFRDRKRREQRRCHTPEPIAPLGLAQIEPVRRQRLVRRTRSALRERVLPGVVIVLDLAQPLARGVLRERLQYDRRTGNVVQQRVEPIVKKRQPVLHSGMTAAFTHRVIKEVVGHGGTKRFHIARPEAADGLGRQLEFRYRHEIERAQLIRGALAFGIEAADSFQRVAKEIEPYRLGHARRVEIDDTATHRVIARLAHRRGPHKSIEFEPAGNVVHREHIAGRDRKRLPRNKVACRHALENGVDGGEQE